MKRDELLRQLATATVIPGHFPEFDEFHVYDDGTVDLHFFRPACRELLQSDLHNLVHLVQRVNSDVLLGVKPGYLKFSRWKWDDNGLLEIVLTFRETAWDIAGIPLFESAELAAIGKLLRKHEMGLVAFRV